MPSTLKGGKRQRRQRNTRRNPLVSGGFRWKAGADTCVFTPVVDCQDNGHIPYQGNPNYISRVVAVPGGGRSWDAKVEEYIKTNYPNFFAQGIVSLCAYACKPKFKASDLTGQPTGTGRGCNSLNQSKRGAQNEYDNLITKLFSEGSYADYVRNHRLSELDSLRLVRHALNAAVGLVPDNGPWVIHADCHLGNILVNKAADGKKRSALADWGRSIAIENPNNPVDVLRGLTAYLQRMKYRSFDAFRTYLGNTLFSQHPPEILRALHTYVIDLTAIVDRSASAATIANYGINTNTLYQNLPALRAFTAYGILRSLTHQRIKKTQTGLSPILQSTSQVDLQNKINAFLVPGFIDINAFPREVAVPALPLILAPVATGVAASGFFVNPQNPSQTAVFARPVSLHGVPMVTNQNAPAIGAGQGAATTTTVAPAAPGFGNLGPITRASTLFGTTAPAAPAAPAATARRPPLAPTRTTGATGQTVIARTRATGATGQTGIGALGQTGIALPGGLGRPAAAATGLGQTGIAPTEQTGIALPGDLGSPAAAATGFGQRRPVYVFSQAKRRVGTGAGTGFIRQPEAAPALVAGAGSTRFLGEPTIFGPTGFKKGEAAKPGLRERLEPARTRRDAEIAAAVAAAAAGQQAATITGISGVPSRQGAATTTTTTTTTTAAPGLSEEVGRFFNAIYYIDVDGLRELIDGGFNVNKAYKIQEGINAIYPLEYAIKWNRPGIVRELLSSGANHCSLTFVNTGGAGEYITMKEYVENFLSPLGTYGEIEKMFGQLDSCRQAIFTQKSRKILPPAATGARAGPLRTINTMTATQILPPAATGAGAGPLRTINTMNTTQILPPAATGAGAGAGDDAVSSNSNTSSNSSVYSTNSNSSPEGGIFSQFTKLFTGGRTRKQKNKKSKKTKQSKRHSRR